MARKIHSGNFLNNDPENPFKNRIKIYQKRPELWYKERWGGDVKNIRWSDYDEYEGHDWDGTKDPLFMAWRAIAAYKWPAVESCTGAGKCLGKGTLVRMFDGSSKAVEDVEIGDVLMGHDDAPRTVTNVNTGVEEMFHVKTGNNGEGFVCNRSHVLTLKSTKQLGSDILDISVHDLLERQKDEPEILNNLRSIRKGYSIKESDLGISEDDLYLEGFGCAIRDVPSFVRENFDYIFSGTDSERVSFLSGMIDGFESLSKFFINHRNRKLPKGNKKELRIFVILTPRLTHLKGLFVDLCHSLHIRATSYEDSHVYINSIRVDLSGDLPKLKLRRSDISGWNKYTPEYHLYPFSLESLGPGTYYGFTLKEDPHFLLSDGVITHNTYMLKLIIYWYLDCFPNAIIITLATKFDQLKKTLWKEIYKDWPKFQQLRPSAEYFNKPKITLKLPVLDDKGMEIKNMWDVREAYATTAHAGKDEEVAQGGAGDHGENMLIIIDEASGVSMPILRAYENTCTGPKNVLCLFGNPKTQLDALHQFRLKPHTIGITVSGLDHPNVVKDPTDFSFLLNEETSSNFDMEELKSSVEKGEHDMAIPGAVSPKRVLAALAEYGPDHPMFLRLVRGKSPEGSISSIIKAASVKDCHNIVPKLEDKNSPYFVGIDVARSAKGDKACVTIIKDHELIFIKEFQCPDASAIAYNLYYSGPELHEWLDKYSDDINRFYELPNLLEMGVDPYNVAVDAIGVGVSTLETFHGPPIQYSVCGVSGSKSYIPELIPKQVAKENPLFRFARLKAQMVWLAERTFRKKTLSIRVDGDHVSEDMAKKLRLELASYKQSTNDRARYYDLQRKKDMNSSPNVADSFLFAELMRQCWLNGVPPSIFDIGGSKPYFGVHF